MSFVDIVTQYRKVLQHKEKKILNHIHGTKQNLLKITVPQINKPIIGTIYLKMPI
jgi:hypothetical protein